MNDVSDCQTAYLKLTKKIYDPLEQFNICELITKFSSLEDLEIIVSNSIQNSVNFKMDTILEKLNLFVSKEIIIFICLFFLYQHFLNSGEVGIYNKNPNFNNLLSVLVIKTGFLLYVKNAFFKLIKIILNDNTSFKRTAYISILYCLFFFIFFFNIVGLLPFSYTLTSNLVVTLFLANIHFIGVNVLGIYKKGWKFVEIFVPSGLPLALVPFLIIIELISYVAKVVSLSVRLFANMMSGHALLKILIGFSWTLLGCFSCSTFLLSLIPWITVTLIFFLEALIAFLQAYVFVILLTIYLNDLMTEH